MAGTTKFPGALDDGSTLYQPGGGDLVSSVDHAQLHDNSSLAIIAAETKVGTGSSTPTSGTVLRGNGTGTSQWAQANLTTDVTGTLPVANGGTGATSATGTGNVVLANTPSLTNPAFSSITNTGTLTLPSSTDTLVGRATTDTLTNKSMDGGSNTLTNIDAQTIDFNQNANGTKTAVTGARIEAGWAAFTFGGSASNANVSVSFKTAFTNAPIVTCTFGGDQLSGSVAYGSGGSTVQGDVSSKAAGISTSGFTLYCYGVTAGWTSGETVYWQWMAVGK